MLNKQRVKEEYSQNVNRLRKEALETEIQGLYEEENTVNNEIDAAVDKIYNYVYGGEENGNSNRRLLGQQVVSGAQQSITTGGSGKASVSDSPRSGDVSGSSGFTINKDSAGKLLPPETRKRLKDTDITDENGNVLELFHWTPNTEFTEFGEGDIGFHFGSKDQATNRAVNTGHVPETDGRYIRVYLNIKHPAIITSDQYEWGAAQAAFQAWRSGYITQAEYDNIFRLSQPYQNNSPKASIRRKFVKH